MTDVSELPKYAGYFVVFSIVVLVAVMAVSQIESTTNTTENNSSDSPIDSSKIKETINKGVNILVIGITIAGAWLVLKSMDVI